MKKILMVLAIAFTMVAGLFAEEKKWNVEHHIRTVTPDEFYATVRLNPFWQEYEWWICEDPDHDDVVDSMYMDPYWDNDEAKTVMKRIAQEEESIEKEKDYTKEVYAFVEISYGDSSVCSLDTFRMFIRNLKTYEMWEFCFSEAALALSEKNKESIRKYVRSLTN